MGKEKRNKKACTIGSATQDMFILYEGAETLHLHQKNKTCSYMLLEQGDKIDVPHVHYATGGGGTNSAVGLTNMGLSVKAFFRTGDDPAGVYIRESLSRQNICLAHCPIDTAHNTGLSVIIPSIEQDHTVFCHRAANKEQRKEDFPLSMLKDLDLLFIGPLGGQSRELLPFLAPAASNAGAVVAINPSLQQLTMDANQFIQTLQHIDILIINTKESGYVMQALLKESAKPSFSLKHTHGTTPQKPYISFTNLHFTINDVMKQIVACGPRIVIITNSAEGAYLATPEKLYFQPSIPAENIYSLGAGDAFTSGFLGSYIQESSLEKALLYGTINANSVIHYPDAKQGLLTYAELEQRATHLNVTTLISGAL